MTEVEICSVEGCEGVAKSLHLCSKHYMQRWRNEERQIKDAQSAALRRFGSPTEYACSGVSGCEETPDRWWAVLSKEPKAMCKSCAERTLEMLRMRIRTLEVK